MQCMVAGSGHGAGGATVQPANAIVPRSASLPSEWRDPYDRATLLIIHLAVFMAGFDFQLRSGISATIVISIGLLPLWAPALRSYSLAPLIGVLALLAALSGLLLSEIASIDHGVVRQHQVESLALHFSGLGAAAILLWARLSVPLHRVVMLFGAGALLHSVANGNLSWKFGLAVPTTVLVLGLVERGHRRGLSVLIVLGLGLVGVLDEGRSLFGMSVLAATLTLWQMWPRPAHGTRGRWRPALLMLGLAVGIYSLASTLLTGGYLGETIQERSVTQIETSGSLITGGRPEWAATAALMQERPSGFGLGVVPSWEDFIVAKQGLDSTNVAIDGYAANYMFAGRFRLHSVAADLWVSFGVTGLALAATMLFALVRSISFAIADRRAPTSVIFFSLLAIWFMMFGPIYSNWLEVCAALGLALTRRIPAESSQAAALEHGRAAGLAAQR